MDTPKINLPNQTYTAGGNPPTAIVSFDSVYHRAYVTGANTGECWLMLWAFDNYFTTRLGAGHERVDYDFAGTSYTIPSTHEWHRYAYNAEPGELFGSYVMGRGLMTAWAYSKLDAGPLNFPSKTARAEVSKDFAVQ